MSEQRKAVIKNADMTEDMQQDAVDIASQALAKYNIEKVRTCNWLLFLIETVIEVVKRIGLNGYSIFIGCLIY